MPRLRAARALAVVVLALAATAGLAVAAPSAWALPGAYVSPATVAVGETYVISGGGCVNPLRAPGELPPQVEIRGAGIVAVLWAEDDGHWSLPTIAEHGGTF